MVGDDEVGSCNNEIDLETSFLVDDSRVKVRLCSNDIDDSFILAIVFQPALETWRCELRKSFSNTRPKVFIDDSKNILPKILRFQTRLGFVLFVVSHLDGHHFSIETLWLCSPGDVDGESLCESIRINNDDNVSPGLVFDRNAILYWFLHSWFIRFDSSDWH